MKKPKVVSTTKTVSPTKEDEIYGPDDPAEAAFTQSDVHTLNDLTLQPFTIKRRWAADKMELLYGLVDEAGVEFYKKTLRYPGLESDVAIVLWLCSLEDEREVDEARRNPRAAIDKAAIWAEEHNLGNRKSPEFENGVRVFLKIMDEVVTSRSTPEQKDNESANPKD